MTHGYGERRRPRSSHGRIYPCLRCDAPRVYWDEDEEEWSCPTCGGRFPDRSTDTETALAGPGERLQEEHDEQPDVTCDRWGSLPGLRCIRRARGWTQGDLADLIQTGRDSISDWENGHSDPSLQMVLRLLDVTQVTFEALTCRHQACGLSIAGPVERVQPKKPRKPSIASKSPGPGKGSKKLPYPMPDSVMIRMMAGFPRREDDGCWIWSRYTDPSGYARIHVGKGHTEYVHRLMYVAFNGPIPEGKEIDHLCSSKSCVNPQHLEAVAHQVNTQRAHTQYASLRRELDDVPPEVRDTLRQVRLENTP